MAQRNSIERHTMGNGFTIFLSGPSGVGKTTVADRFVKDHGFKLIKVRARDARDKLGNPSYETIANHYGTRKAHQTFILNEFCSSILEALSWRVVCGSDENLIFERTPLDVVANTLAFRNNPPWAKAADVEPHNPLADHGCDLMDMATTENAAIERVLDYDWIWNHHYRVAVDFMNSLFDLRRNLLRSHKTMIANLPINHAYPYDLEGGIRPPVNQRNNQSYWMEELWRRRYGPMYEVSFLKPSHADEYVEQIETSLYAKAKNYENASASGEL